MYERTLKNMNKRFSNGKDDTDFTEPRKLTW